MTYGALATLDDNAAIAEIASGTLSKEIAARYGVTPRGLRKRLAQHPDYAEAIKEQAASLVEQATEYAFAAGNADVPIARVRLDAAHKWAAARDPAQWGAKQQMTVEHVLRVEQRLERDLSALLGRVVEGETIAQEQRITHQEGATDSISCMSNPEALPSSNTSAERRAAHLDHLAALVPDDEP